MRCSHPVSVHGSFVVVVVVLQTIFMGCDRSGVQAPAVSTPVDAIASADTATPTLAFQDHGYVNPFTGVVPWGNNEGASRIPDVFAMEWRHVGLSEVYPVCSGPGEWSKVDDFLRAVALRGHQAILRPVVVAPGYGDWDGDGERKGHFAPSDLPSSGLTYGGEKYENPRWDHARVQTCILLFIEKFAERYRGDLRVAYIQMGLVGLWGEHHIEGTGSKYTIESFPSVTFQKKMISAYLGGFETSSSDLLCSVSLDSAQEHGFFGSPDGSLDSERVGFFDDTLLAAGHGLPFDGEHWARWRQKPAPAKQLRLHRKHGWGGEAGFDNGCNDESLWTRCPYDCGNGEALHDQAARLGLNYMLGDNAFRSVDPAHLLVLAQMMGYKFTATGVAREGDGAIAVTVQNTGVAYCPYKVEVCTGPEVCAGDLSKLAPGASTVVNVPASASPSQVLSLTSPRLSAKSPQKIRWSNVGAADSAATLTVTVDEG